MIMGAIGKKQQIVLYGGKRMADIGGFMDVENLKMRMRTGVRKYQVGVGNHIYPTWE